MTDKILKRLWTLAGITVTIAGLISLITSDATKAWVKNHSYWVFISFILSILAGFIAVDYAKSTRGRAPTPHDREIVSSILDKIPPDSEAVIWLKELYNTKLSSLKYVSIFDAVHSQMRRNVIELDSPEVNQAHARLRDAMGEFQSLAALHVSTEGDYRGWEETEKELNIARSNLIEVYDDFLRISHRNHLC